MSKRRQFSCVGPALACPPWLGLPDAQPLLNVLERGISNLLPDGSMISQPRFTDRTRLVPIRRNDLDSDVCHRARWPARSSRVCGAVAILAAIYIAISAITTDSMLAVPSISQTASNVAATRPLQKLQPSASRSSSVARVRTTGVDESPRSPVTPVMKTYKAQNTQPLVGYGALTSELRGRRVNLAVQA
eukprot:1361749-Amorphochlora_amoeboformis.AAC.1